MIGLLAHKWLQNKNDVTKIVHLLHDVQDALRNKGWIDPFRGTILEGATTINDIFDPIDRTYRVFGNLEGTLATMWSDMMDLASRMLDYDEHRMRTHAVYARQMLNKPRTAYAITIKYDIEHIIEEAEILFGIDELLRDWLATYMPDKPAPPPVRPMPLPLVPENLFRPRERLDAFLRRNPPILQEDLQRLQQQAQDAILGRRMAPDFTSDEEDALSGDPGDGPLQE